MLRITRLDAATKATVLRLEGRLTASELGELEAVLGECRRQKRRVVLDLAGLVFLDDTAASALRSAGRQHCELVGASPFVQQLLREEPS